jgi:hypothetical protein
MIIIGLVTVYIVGMILMYGLYFGYFQHRFPMVAEDSYNEDLMEAFIYGVFWPISIIAFCITCDFKHGLKFI